MKNVKLPSLILWVILSLSFTHTVYGVSKGGNDENMIEKMTIFSLISLTVISIALISFSENRRRSILSTDNANIIQKSITYPFTTPDLTKYPIYVWDSRYSFYKIVFDPDGVFLVSLNVLTNGIDPMATPAGVWELTFDGNIQVTFSSTGAKKIYSRITKDSSTLLIQPNFGAREVWYVGNGGLANIQISIFGYSASVPATIKFTNAYVCGRTFYWATYPFILVTAAGDVTVNEETTFGMLKFNDNGVLTKSISNMVSNITDFLPTFSGKWSVDDSSGILTMIVSSITTKLSALTNESEHCEFIVHTPSENRIWFTDQSNAPERLASYIAEGCILIS